MAKTLIDPCPFCNAPVEMCGSECYPESGLSAECTECSYELAIVSPIRTNNIQLAASMTHSLFCDAVRRGVISIKEAR